MIELILEGLAPNVDEATVKSWFFEEGDLVTEGDDLVELSTEEGTVIIHAPVTGILAEVYYDEGELAGKGEILCMVDNDESGEDEDEEDDDDEEADKDDKDEEAEVKDEE